MLKNLLERLQCCSEICLDRQSFDFSNTEARIFAELCPDGYSFCVSVFLYRGITASPSSVMNGMRGLTVFISDLRNARARETEEKRINTELAKIRLKFRDARLNGYDRKKYVSKLLYMYILGWSIDFGHLEAVTLISSNKFSEKQIGYLAVTLFLNEHHDLLHLVVNSLKKDLTDSNELFNCLALHCVANVGGSEMGNSLATDVHQLLISRYVPLW